MLSNDSRVFRRKVWACLSVVCPSRVPTNQRTVADAAKVHGVSTGALYKLKSQAREYFDDYLALQKNKASLTLEESSAGSDFMPSFSHGKGRKGRNARK